jgi:lipid II:glycine glycyltransferase (peptidoglycan interpeptide bridge formation enzyme)
LKRDTVMLSYYYHCACTEKIPGFSREPKFTKLLDITQTEDELLAGFNKTTRYEVRRADQKDELEFGFVEDWQSFRDYYNQFAAQKDLGDIDDSIISSYWNDCVVTKVTHTGHVLVMHVYLVDHEASRVNLTYSAAHFRGMDDKNLRALNSRANRWLHFADMRHFRQCGFRCFDFGGYAHETTDKQLQAVNAFKDGFGGNLVEESNYSSRALMLLRRAKDIVRRHKRRR